MESWLKYYLGLFFNFREFGNLNWIAIPLFVYLAATLKKRKRWEIALAFVYMLSCLFLSAVGKGYDRYLFSLYPFTLGAIFLYGQKFIKKKGLLLRIGILSICTLAIFFSFYHSRDAYKSHWKSYINVVDDDLPRELMKYIDTSEDYISGATTLVCSHRHLFHYYTDKKGIDFRDPKMEIFYRKENKEAALKALKNQLKVTYIWLDWDFNTRFGLRNILSDIITNDCDLVFQEKGRYLYRLYENNSDTEEFDKDKTQ